MERCGLDRGRNFQMSKSKVGGNRGKRDRVRRQD